MKKQAITKYKKEQNKQTNKTKQKQPKQKQNTKNKKRSLTNFVYHN